MAGAAGAAEPGSSASWQPVVQWADILAHYQTIKPDVAGSLAGSKAYIVGNNFLIIAENPFFLQLLKVKENALSLRTTLKQLLGADYNIRAKRAGAQQASLPPAAALLEKAKNSGLDVTSEQR